MTFDRKREELAALGIDPARLPPGQYHTERWPVLHAGVVPEVDLATWDFTVDGLVAERKSWTYDEFRALGAETRVADVHCVTKWSLFDAEFEGVPTETVLDHIELLPGAEYVLVNAEHGFTANLPLEDFAQPENLFAWGFRGGELTPDHGWPLRLVVPHLYFWKSVKWVRGFTVLSEDEPGFWERNGYHMRGDPWTEERYWGD
ncbi:MAG: sulfite oxidase-like oxidoreductase [Acidimicrobiia bacterium]